MKLFSSRSETTKSWTVKLSARLLFYSRAVKEIFVLKPLIPSCLISESVENVKLPPLSKKAYVMTAVWLTLCFTFTGTIAMPVLEHPAPVRLHIKCLSVLTIRCKLGFSVTNIVLISAAGITIHLFTRLSMKNSWMPLGTTGELARFTLMAVLCNVFIRQTSKTETSWC